MSRSVWIGSQPRVNFMHRLQFQTSKRDSGYVGGFLNDLVYLGGQPLNLLAKGSLILLWSERVKGYPNWAGLHKTMSPNHIC